MAESDLVGIYVCIPYRQYYVVRKYVHKFVIYLLSRPGVPCFLQHLFASATIYKYIWMVQNTNRQNHFFYFGNANNNTLEKLWNYHCLRNIFKSNF